MTYQAIETRYCGPIGSKGSRVTAQCAGGRVILDWDDALNSDENHAAAVRKLCNKLDWRGERYEFVQGTLKNGNTVWVCTAGQKVVTL